MVIVGSNLRSLVSQYSMCSDSRFDETGIHLNMSRSIVRPHVPADGPPVIRYGASDVSHYFKHEELDDGELTLLPGQAILCCSAEPIFMPPRYFGLVQTKGSLARLFVTATVTDGQIDPGFRGHVTLEMVNHSPFKIVLPIGCQVAKIYVLKCSTLAKEYEGRYRGFDVPTICKYGIR